MSKEVHDKDVKFFDTRVVERNIQKGLITRKDYDKYLKSLGDAKDKTRPAGDQAAVSANDDRGDDLLGDDDDDEAGQGPKSNG